MADRTVFARRRARFFDRWERASRSSSPPRSASFGHDVHYRYRPDPDFFYLTGFGEPDAIAVLDAEARTFTLFVLPRDRERETWEGRRAGPEGGREDVRGRQGHPAGRAREAASPT